MPTFDKTSRFERDCKRLTDAEMMAFKAAVQQLVAGLRAGQLQNGLRVKGVQGKQGVFEMTFAGDGRATFEYGQQIKPGETHIVWRRVGTHDIFKDA